MRRVGSFTVFLVLAVGCEETPSTPHAHATPPAPPPDDAEPVPPAEATPSADGAAPDAEQTPPSRTEDAPQSGLAAVVEAIHRPDVTQIQERLAKVLTVTRRSGAPPATPITWGAPSCPLRYQFQADVTMSMLDGPGGVPKSFGDQGLRIAGDVTMEAGDGGLAVLHNGELELSQVMGGVKRPGGKEKPKALAEVRLRRDGLQWTEVDGPTALWSSYGSFPGMVEFWPALPSATAPGSTGPWALTLHEQGDGLEVESTRGEAKVPEGFEFPEPSPRTFDAEVEVQGWLDVEGRPAVVLVSQWAHDHSSKLEMPEMPKEEAAGSGTTPKVPDVDFDVAIQARSRYVVLESGRLLWADVHRITHVDMAMGPGKSMKQRHDLRATARLVEACDGPTIDEPPPEASPEEAALEVFALLRNAAFEGDREQMAEHLAPELLSAHGEDPLLELLQAHVARYGALVLGTPEISWDVRREGDRVRMHMTGRAQLADGSGTTVHTVAWAQTVDGKTTIMQIGTDTIERDEGWSVLELSTTAMKAGEVK